MKHSYLTLGTVILLVEELMQGQNKHNNIDGEYVSITLQYMTNLHKI